MARRRRAPAAEPTLIAGVHRPTWWGWGTPVDTHQRALTATVAKGFSLRGKFSPPDLDGLHLPTSSLTSSVEGALLHALATGEFHTDDATRIAHSGGKSYLDLLRMRDGNVAAAPDAVAYPATTAEVLAIVSLCATHSVDIIPYGGGTSVVGGVTPSLGRVRPLLCVDLSLLAAVTDLDEISLTVTAQAGLSLPALEGYLRDRGYTLGHFPQSFEFVTVGGCAAARGAGQASSRYGRFDDMVVGLRMATPRGELAVAPFPGTAAGPRLLEIVLGSEGRFGIITSVTLAIHRRPTATLYEAWSCPSFSAGVDLMRQIVQEGLPISVARLSDVEESRLTLAAATHGIKGAVGRRYLALRGHGRPALAIVGIEASSRQQLKERHRDITRLFESRHAISLGEGAGRAWEQQRFDGPYVRDQLMDKGALVETFETATSWANLEHLHREVLAAVEGALNTSKGRAATVGCHISHLYHSGASLYFTVVGKQSDAPAAQWAAAKTAAMTAITRNGGTITHHHGVGRDHAPWLAQEIGSLGMDIVSAIAATVDPTGIMNPGVLIPPSA